MCTWIVCRVIYASRKTDGLFRGFLAVMIISSCKMVAKGKKADCHLRLVQIKLRKNVCKSLRTKCASISNYLIHVMLSYLYYMYILTSRMRRRAIARPRARLEGVVIFCCACA